MNILNPGGDGGAIRRAAAAWRRMDALLKDIDREIADAEERLLGDTWTGQARDQYEHLRKLDSDSAGAASGVFLDMASKLDDAAGEIDGINRQIHRIELEVAASLAVGGLLTLVTAGLSDAAAAAETVAAEAEAASLVARLATFLARLARLFEGITTAVKPYLVRFAAQYRFGIGLNAVMGASLHWIQAGNPMVGWSSTTFTEMQLGSLIGGAFAVPMDMPWAEFLRVNPARPWVPGVAMTVGVGVGGVAYRVVDGVLIRRESPLEAVKEGGLFSLYSMALAGVTGSAWSMLATKIRAGASETPSGIAGLRYGQYYLWEPSPAKAGLLRSVIIGAVGSAVPALSPFRVPPGTQLPSVPAAPVVPGTRLPAIPPPPASPPTTQRPPPGPHPVRVVVRLDDSLWAIAQREYGNPELWPAIARANPGISDPSVIHPGQVITVPHR